MGAAPPRGGLVRSRGAAVAVVALTAGTVLIWQAKGRTEAALARAREQERVAQENGAQAETRQRQAEAAYVAETIQRKQAEANARLAWQTFPDELFTQALQVWGAGRPELAEARRKALLNALRFYETFAREEQHFAELRPHDPAVHDPLLANPVA